MSCSPLPFRTDDLQLVKGADAGWSWAVVDLDGDPLDMTGWTAVAQARVRAGAPDPPRAEWTTDLGEGITISGSELTLRIDGDESGAWDWNTSVYEILVSSPTDGPFYFTGGTIHARAGVVSP